MIINARSSETSDLYMNVVARPLSNLRIAVCRNAIQWLVQVRDGSRHGPRRKIISTQSDGLRTKVRGPSRTVS